MDSSWPCCTPATRTSRHAAARVKLIMQAYYARLGWQAVPMPRIAFGVSAALLSGPRAVPASLANAADHEVLAALHTTMAPQGSLARPPAMWALWVAAAASTHALWRHGPAYAVTAPGPAGPTPTLRLVEFFAPGTPASALQAVLAAALAHHFPDSSHVQVVAPAGVLDQAWLGPWTPGPESGPGAGLDMGFMFQALTTSGAAALETLLAGPFTFLSLDNF